MLTMGHTPRIMSARFVKPYLKSNKTDIVDAVAIVEAVMRPGMRFVELRTPEQIDLPAHHRVRDRIVAQRTGLINQARAFCLEYGLPMRVGTSWFHLDIRRHLNNQDDDLKPDMRVLLEELLDDLAHLERRLKDITARLETVARQDDTIRRLLTIPGIGPLNASALVAAAGDGRQFRKARDMAAWPGLVPAEHSIGGRQRLLGISKRGNRYVRRMIVHGARSCFLHLNREHHALGRWLNTL